MYEMTKNDYGPRVFFGKVYQWVVNEVTGRLSLQKVEVTDEDRAEFDEQLKKLAEEDA